MNPPDKQELVKYRITKARETLKEVELHIQNELWSTAVNRLYYNCFYGVTALLIHYGLNAKTHAGTRQMFGLHFIKPGIITKESGDFYTEIFDLRQTGDYADFIVFEKSKVLAYWNPHTD